MQDTVNHTTGQPIQRSEYDPVNIVFEDLLARRHQAQLLVKAKTIRNNKQNGNYSSKFKGRGMQFEEVRPYVAGDDFRNLDWKVTARTNKPHTKLYEEERERPVQLFLDLRAPMFFGTRSCFKAVWAAHAASLISWASLLQNDRVGGLVFSELAHQEFKPQLNSRGVLRFIKAITEHPVNNFVQQQQLHTPRPESVPNTYQDDVFYYSLMRLRRVTKPGSRLFLLSDFRDWSDKHHSQIVRLSRHNEIIIFFCYDPFENQLPDRGMLRVSDGVHDIEFDSHRTGLRHQYHAKFEQRLAAIQQLASFSNVNIVTASTSDSVFDVVSSVFSSFRSAKRSKL